MSNLYSDPCIDTDFTMPADTAMAIVRALKAIGGPAVCSLDGDCSVQVSLQLSDGRHIRFGYTDTDCYANRDALWIDEYPRRLL
jgi:hypothetical protein